MINLCTREGNFSEEISPQGFVEECWTNPLLCCSAKTQVSAVSLHRRQTVSYSRDVALLLYLFFLTLVVTSRNTRLDSEYTRLALSTGTFFYEQTFNECGTLLRLKILYPFFFHRHIKFSLLRKHSTSAYVSIHPHTSSQPHESQHICPTSLFPIILSVSTSVPSFYQYIAF